MMLWNIIPLAGALNGMRLVEEECRAHGTCDDPWLAVGMAVPVVVLLVGLIWLAWQMSRDGW